jgi:hypothetical protein
VGKVRDDLGLDDPIVIGRSMGIHMVSNLAARTDVNDSENSRPTPDGR